MLLVDGPIWAYCYIARLSYSTTAIQDVYYLRKYKASYYEKGPVQQMRRKMFDRGVRFALLHVVAVVAAGTLTPAFGATFTTIDVPGAAFTGVSGINTRGDIVGAYDGHGYLLS